MRNLRLNALLRLIAASWCVACGVLSAQSRANCHPQAGETRDIHTAFDCIGALFSEPPVHGTLGSVAPSNGVPLGIELEDEAHPITSKEQSSTIHRRLTLVGSTGAAWGLSGDMTRTAATTVVIRPNKDPCHQHWGRCTTEVPHMHFNANYSSIPTIYFFGLGPASPAVRYQFGEDRFGAEVDATHPVTNWLDVGGNLEVVQTRVKHDNSSTGIAAVFSETTVPGLASHPGYLHPSVTVILHGMSVYETAPTAGGAMAKRPIPTAESTTAAAQAENFKEPQGPTVKPRLTYTWHVATSFHEFLALGDDRYSYQQFTYRGERTLVVGGIHKPGDTWASRTFCGHGKNAICDFGSFTLNSRLVLTHTNTGQTVPFYLQETVGGSDVNSIESLRAYDNYRFRGPDATVVQAEYSIRMPKFRLSASAFGPFVFYDAGTVGQRAEDLAPSRWRQDGGLGVFVMFGGSVALKGYVAAGAGHGVKLGASFNHFF